MRQLWWWRWRAWCAATMLVLLASCGSDLGECDMAALGGHVGMLTPPARPHEGQKVINRSCAGGLCHSATATGDQRRGAPGGLDFDVVPNVTTPDLQAAEVVKVQIGYNVVQAHLEAMWDEIADGTMPPARPAGSGGLGEADKETVRNWLACGAPVIAAPEPMDTMADPWTRIYTALRNNTCQACHAPGLGMGSFLPEAEDACAAHAMIVGAAASGPECGSTGAVLVRPNDPAGSLLLQKLAPTPAPPCGVTMPQGQTPLATSDPMLVALIEQWIADGATAPNCP